MTDPGDNWRAEMRAKAEEAIAHLTGTCEPLYHHFEEFMDDRTFCGVLDDAIFECTACGWWEEQPAEDHPQSGQWICADCLREITEEEDEP